MKYFLPIILSVIFLLSLLLARASGNLPLKELKDRSRSGNDPPAHSIYRVARYGVGGLAAVWKVGFLSLAGLLLLAFASSWWLGFLSVLLACGLLVGWNPTRSARGWAWRLAGLWASLFAQILSIFRPILVKVEPWLARWHKPSAPTTVYEKVDLLELLKSQSHAPGNRITKTDLQTAVQALTFNDKSIHDIITPLQKVKWVGVNEPISPMIMDELHKTGQQRFPVVKDPSKTSKPQVEGNLFINDLLNNLEQKGKIRDLMRPGVEYIGQNASLAQALNRMITSGQQLLMVVDGSQKLAGIVTIEAVLQQVFSETIFENADEDGVKVIE